MKKTAAAVLALIFVVFLSSCATRRIAAYPPVHSRTRISISTETRSIHNNSDFLLVPQEDGLPVELQLATGDKNRSPVFAHLQLQTGDSVPLSYFQWSSRRTVSLVVKAYCPPSGSITSSRVNSRTRNQENVGCKPGQYMGISRPRTVSVSSRGRSRYGSRDFIYENRDIIGPTGRPYW